MCWHIKSAVTKLVLHHGLWRHSVQSKALVCGQRVWCHSVQPRFTVNLKHITALTSKIKVKVRKAMVSHWFFVFLCTSLYRKLGLRCQFYFLHSHVDLNHNLSPVIQMSVLTIRPWLIQWKTYALCRCKINNMFQRQQLDLFKWLALDRFRSIIFSLPHVDSNHSLLPKAQASVLAMRIYMKKCTPCSNKW